MYKKMKIGIPKEIKNDEYRIAITPIGVNILIKAGHQVTIEKNSGIGSGFSDVDYMAAGAKIVDDAEKVYDIADMIIKVREPALPEYDLLHEGQIFFSFLHLAGVDPLLTQVLLEKKIVSVAYETIELPNGLLPLLNPMSEIAGKMSVQIGAQFLEKNNGGKGLLLGGVPGIEPGRVLIIGGGVVGSNAAKIATGMGAQVTIVDKCLNRLKYLDDFFRGRIRTIISNECEIEKEVKNSDMVIGAILKPGARAEHVVTEKMVKQMLPGSVIIDVSVDQGGCIETVDRMTSLSNPTYEKYGIIHYCVANIPGAVPRTSTLALTNANLQFATKIADLGWEQAVKQDSALAKGVNTAYGMITHKAVADFFNMEHCSVERLIK
jgi:alanine dehydrogenase